MTLHRAGSLAAVTLCLAASASAAPPPAPLPFLVKSVEGGTTFTSPVAPKKLLVQKAVPWRTLPGTAEPPFQEYGDPQSPILTVELSFDGEAGDDVAPLVHPLEEMTLMDSSLGRPPLVQVVYGSFVFKGVIASLEIEYSRFDNDATKQHAIVRITVRGALGATTGSR